MNRTSQEKIHSLLSEFKSKGHLLLMIRNFHLADMPEVITFKNKQFTLAASNESTERIYMSKDHETLQITRDYNAAAQALEYFDTNGNDILEYSL